MNAQKIRNAVDTLERIRDDRIGWMSEVTRLSRRWWNGSDDADLFVREAVALFDAHVDYAIRKHRQEIIDGLE
jgi:hypothetical protein